MLLFKLAFGCERFVAVIVKISVSLRDDHHAFVKALVHSGCFPSLSAVLQQGLNFLRQQDTDVHSERAALQALPSQRADWPFISESKLRQRLAKHFR